MKSRQRYHLSRRAFLRALATTGGGTLLAACGAVRGGEKIGERLAFGPRATPQILLPSPVPAEATATATPTSELPDFLALSALLTGVANLSPELGRVYLQSLQANRDQPVTVATLLAQAGFQADTPPTTPAALEESGIFAEEQTRTLADKITEMWYTGIYIDESGKDVVATYVDALAWQTLRFTKPKTLCGAPGFWAQAWRPPAGGS